MTIEPKLAWVLTFYSFKGGVGRTLALSNVARYLCEERGYRIGLIDLDLDSPGLPHQPLASSNVSRATIDATLGFTSLFQEAVVQSGQPPTLSSLSESIVEVPTAGNGAIFFMPAAVGSASRTQRFREEVRQVYLTVSGVSQDAAAAATAAIVSSFVQHCSLDLVFIDGRTGHGPFFPVYGYSIPHALVLFVGLNDQNIAGSLDVLKETVAPGPRHRQAPVFLVASPVPTVGPELLESRLEKIAAELAALRLDGTPQNETKYVFALPKAPTYLLPYCDLAAYKESYFVREYPHSGLARAYLNLASDIEQLALPRLDVIETLDDDHAALLRGLSEAADLGRQPLRIAAENISLEPLRHFLKSIGLDPQPPQSTTCSAGAGTPETTQAFVGDGRPLVEIRFWSATDSSAPWESAALGSNPANTPDILLAPQSLLADICSKGLVWAMSPGAMYSLSPSQVSGTAADYGFLESWYGGWRRWCIHNGQLAALPFSMNTTLLLANDRLLQSISARYGPARRLAVPAELEAFFPSNWHMILDLLGGLSQAGAAPAFKFSVDGRALYYEWLNVVLAVGGGDMEMGEGGIRLDVTSPRLTSPETVEGTMLFMRLAEMTGLAPTAPTRMDDLLRDFVSERLAFFMGWSDAVRFSDSGPTRIVALGEENSGTGPEAPRVRLGLFPRDIRYARRPLVANWVATLPRTDDISRSQLSLRALTLFLRPGLQQDLLRRGFPTSSGQVIEQEEARAREASRHGQPGTDLSARNYRVFLESLHAACTNGYLVPPGRRRANAIRDCIAAAIDDDAGRWTREALRTTLEALEKGLPMEGI